MTLQVRIVQFSPISFYFKLNVSVRQLSDILNCVALLWLLDFVDYTINNTCKFASFCLISRCARLFFLGSKNLPKFYEFILNIAAFLI